MATFTQYSPQQPSFHHTASVHRKSSTSSTSSSSSSAASSMASSTQSPSTSLFTSPHLTLSPRVQLIPHTLSLGFDSTFSPSEREALDNTSFDTLDLSSKDFDFEDIFTYDRPQQKLSRVVEVSSPTRLEGSRVQGERDWSEFSFSHYANNAGQTTSPAVTTRDRVRTSRTRSGISEMYLRNGREARKR